MTARPTPGHYLDLMPYMGEFVRCHGRGCAGPVYRNAFGVEYCSWCGWVAKLVPVSRLPKEHKP